MSNDTDTAEAADLAYDRSEGYDWQGQTLLWSIAHQWMWISIIRALGEGTEADAMAAMWLGTACEDDMSAIERAWRANPDDVMDEISSFRRNYHPEGDAVADALRVANDMLEDIKASDNEPDTTDIEEGGGPKKCVA